MATKRNANEKKRPRRQMSDEADGETCDFNETILMNIVFIPALSEAPMLEWEAAKGRSGQRGAKRKGKAVLNPATGRSPPNKYSNEN